ncbi:MAG: hypothetical protein HC888_00855 [Candidatus Competibacteraceae bacterium]|nr:hypothetical protein [Candidatus Competibacteraceae bacterium]
MAVVIAEKGNYTPLLTNTTVPFTAQCLGSHWMEVFIGPSAPSIADPGILVPADALTNRDFGVGQVHARVPFNAPYDTAPVIITGV